MTALLNMCANLFHYLPQDGRHSLETNQIVIFMKNRVSIENSSYETKNRNEQLLPLSTPHFQYCLSHDLQNVMPSPINRVSPIQPLPTLKQQCSMKQEVEEEQLIPSPIRVLPCCNGNVILTNDFGRRNLINQAYKGDP